MKTNCILNQFNNNRFVKILMIFSYVLICIDILKNETMFFKQLKFNLIVSKLLICALLFIFELLKL